MVKQMAVLISKYSEWNQLENRKKQMIHKSESRTEKFTSTQVRLNDDSISIWTANEEKKQQ